MQASAYVRFKPDTEERSTHLYRAYTKWCEDNLESPVPQKKFSQFLLKNAGKYGLTFSKHIEGKFAFVKRSETMKSPVGTLSDRTVLRSKMEGHCPDKLGGICDKRYHGMWRASRWFYKFYCSKAVIVGLIFWEI